MNKDLFVQRGLLTRAQLAAQINKTEMTIFNYEQRGLPVIRVGHTRLYDIADVTDWLKKQSSVA